MLWPVSAVLRLFVMWQFPWFSVVLLATSSCAYPTPADIPPHSWTTVGDQLFLHGCNKDGLFNGTQLSLARKFSILTVEKGQGLALPGYAEDKMAAIAAQWKAARQAAGLPPGRALFYMNAKLDWTFYKLHAAMRAHPAWAVQRAGAASGEPCTAHGDPTFPQPTGGLLCFNHSQPAVRRAFIATCVNATAPAASGGGGFDGCFIDSAGWARGPPYPGSSPTTQAALARQCNATTGSFIPVGTGTEALLVELQAALGDRKLVVAKDGAAGGSEDLVNSIFPMDTFCSCYKCNDWAGEVHQGRTYAMICQAQIQEARRLSKRGQISLLHGQVNAMSVGNSTALAADFEFTLAAFLIAASPTAFFGYSQGWYYSGATWHDEFDKPLGRPLSDAQPGAGSANMTWTRSFQSGTRVTLDVLNHNASIVWGTGVS